MQDYYSVLQVAPEASGAEIKAAFRNRAKSCHPDMKPGDSEAETAFQEVKRAYELLSHPEARKVYDEFLARQRAAKRRRIRRAATTMSASFVLTVATVVGAMIWLQNRGFASVHELAEAAGQSWSVDVVRAAPSASGKLRAPATSKAQGQRGEAAMEKPTEP
jgi:DnaJ-class molecular chaperone